MVENSSFRNGNYFGDGRNANIMEISLNIRVVLKKNPLVVNMYIFV